MTLDAQTLLENVTSTPSLDGARVGFKIKETNSGSMEVDFTVRRGAFCFWNHYLPTDAPLNHPAWSGKKLAFLVDGNIGVVRGHTLTCVLPPEETITRSNALGWSSMKHPYRAEGETFRVRLLTAKLLTPQGESEIRSLLRSALGLDNAYIGVQNYSLR